MFAKADFLVDKIMSLPRIKFSNLQALNLDGVETGVLLSVFAQQLHRKNPEVPDLYLILVDAASISPTLVLNPNDRAKERRGWVFHKTWTSEVAKFVHARW